MFQNRSMFVIAALFAATVTSVACAPGADKPEVIRQRGGLTGCPTQIAVVARTQFRDTLIEGAAIGNNPWRRVYISEDPKVLLTQPVVPSTGWRSASTYYDYELPPTQVSGSERPSRTSCTDGVRYRRWEWRVDVSEIPLADLYNNLVGGLSYTASGITSAINLTAGVPGSGPNAFLSGGSFVYQFDGQFGFRFYRPAVYLTTSSTRTPEGYALFRATDSLETTFELWGRDAFPYWVQSTSANCPTSLGFYRPNPTTDPRWREIRANYRIGCYSRSMATNLQSTYPWDADVALSQGNLWSDPRGRPGIQAGIYMTSNGCPICTIN